MPTVMPTRGVITRQRGVKVGSPKGSFLNLAGVPATGPTIPPNTAGGEFLNRESRVRVAPGAPDSEYESRESVKPVYQWVLVREQRREQRLQHDPGAARAPASRSVVGGHARSTVHRRAAARAETG